MNVSNVTAPTPAPAGLGAAECLQGTFPCSNTITGNTFLVLAYGFLVAYGSKYIAEGAEQLLEIFDPGIISGIVLPILGALPDAAVIGAAVVGASGAQAAEALSVGIGTLAGSSMLLLTLPWIITMVVGNVPLNADGVGGALTRADFNRFHLSSKSEKEETGDESCTSPTFWTSSGVTVFTDVTEQAWMMMGWVACAWDSFPSLLFSSPLSSLVSLSLPSSSLLSFPLSLLPSPVPYRTGPSSRTPLSRSGPGSGAQTRREFARSWALSTAAATRFSCATTKSTI